MEYSAAEGTHKDHIVQILTPHRTTPKIRNQRRIYVEINHFAFAPCSVTKWNSNFARIHVWYHSSDLGYDSTEISSIKLHI